VNRLILSTVVFVLCIGVAVSQAFSTDDVAKHRNCPFCGMDRQTFSHSRMLAIYENSSETGVCSLHCLALDLALNLDKAPKAIFVGDFKTKKLLDADQAVWVVGGTKTGVMSKRAKWAFEKKTDAEAYIQENGGELGTFETALKAAYEDMYLDTKMIRERRKMKRMQTQQPGQMQQQPAHGEHR
jgi:copper chaperone NosL